MPQKISSICLALLSALSLISCATKGPIKAPNLNATAINQVPIDRNGCGPIAVMNAFKFGSPKWAEVNDNITGNTHKQKFNNLIKTYGRRLSKHSRANIRWNKNNGINALDLTDLANECKNDQNLTLPDLKLSSFFIKKDETHAQLLARTHSQLYESLQKGFPPVISIKCFAKSPYGRSNFWRQHYGHFVVVYEIPGTLSPEATSFTIKYIDPWGGRIKSGTIKIPEKGFFALDPTATKPVLSRSPTLAIDFPQTSLGKYSLKKNQKSATILSSSIGL